MTKSFIYTWALDTRDRDAHFPLLEKRRHSGMTTG